MNNDLSNSTIPDELKQADSEIIKSWDQQTRKVEAELDNLVEEFSTMIDEMKKGLQKCLQQRKQTLAKRIEQYFDCRNDYVSKARIPPPQDIRNTDNLKTYIAAIQNSKNTTLVVHREELLHELSQIKGLTKTDPIDDKLQQAKEGALRKFAEIHSLFEWPEPRPALSIADKIERRIELASSPAQNNKEVLDLQLKFSSTIGSLEMTSDHKTVKGLQEDQFFCCDVDLSTFQQPVRWKVRMEGKLAFAVGIAMTKFTQERRLAPPDMWMLETSGTIISETEGEAGIVQRQKKTCSRSFMIQQRKKLLSPAQIRSTD
eukprot:TRINITY_DN3284_c0_g1_i2.p1 TRINITY_DN3284_c0_g1~~TRINITY_DN3284_c0_g1_i2.p1  ORF type:complete len:316 (+),score=27.60 TRINITY_DN3284_c0_g1_i2:129-1076(+)